MKKKVIAVLALAIAALALLPMASASAAHRIGGYDAGCFTRTNSSAYNGVRVAVEGLGSDVPRNALVAGRGHVSADARCNKAGGIRVVRVQIDRLVLLHGASVLTQSGPYNNGTNNVVGQTAGKGQIPCSWNLRVYVHFTARSADNTLGEGALYGPYFRRC